MKIVVTAVGASLEAAPCPTFGRSPYLLIYETETDTVNALPNPALETDRGAGVEAARCVVSNGATTVCTGRMGPNAWEVCEAAGITVLASRGDTARDVLERQERGELKALTPSGPRHGRRGR